VQKRTAGLAESGEPSPAFDLWLGFYVIFGFPRICCVRLFFINSMVAGYKYEISEHESGALTVRGLVQPPRPSEAYPGSADSENLG
jgi:hypothetical protein